MLNSFLDPDEIVRVLLGRTIPLRSLPAMIPCPVCRTKRMSHVKAYSDEEFCLRVMRDPGGGALWQCRYCERTRDSIELIADTKFHGKLAPAIDFILRSQELCVSVGAFYPRAISEYRHGVELAASRRKWSDRARRRWAEGRGTYSGMAERLGIHVDSSESVDSELSRTGRWLHATGYQELADVVNNGAELPFPRPNFTSCLAVPWSNRPGIISALFLVGWNEETRLWMLDGAGSDPGIMLVDVIPHGSKRVYAISSPFLTLWLQHRYLREQSGPAPITTWHTQTDPSVWSDLGVEEVVFWSYRPCPSVLAHALNVPRSKVAFSSWDIDTLLEDASLEHVHTWNQLRKYLDRPVPAWQIMEQLIGNPRDPVDVCCDYLLDLDISHVATAVEAMRLGQNQIANLLRSCSGDRRDMLEQRLTIGRRRQRVRMFGGEVIQYVGPDRAEWRIYKRNRDELISDAVIRLDQCVHDALAKETQYTGVIQHAGHSFPFACSRNELMRDPISVIADTVESNGLPTPFISTRFARHIWDLSHMFSLVPRSTPALTRVGWDSGRAFAFPEFSLRNGHVETRSMYVSLADVPCRNLQPPPVPTSEGVLAASGNEYARAWAVVSLVLDNIVAPVERRSTRGIAVTGPSSVSVVKSLSDGLCVSAVEMHEIVDRMGEFEVRQSLHDVPAVLIASEDGAAAAQLSGWMTSPGTRNVLAALSHPRAAMASSYADWVVVDVGESPCLPPELIAGVVVHFLARYQTLESRVGHIDAVPGLSSLNILDAWLEVLCGQRVAAIRAARRVLRRTGASSTAERLVSLMLQLISDGQLAYDYGSTMRSGVVVDLEARRVYVSKFGVVDAMRKRGLPPLDSIQVASALRDANALVGEVGIERGGWAIDYGFWETCAARWAKMTQVEPDDTTTTEVET